MPGGVGAASRPRFRWCGSGLPAAIYLLCAALLTPWAQSAPPADLRLNDIQLLGSHNSYKLAMAAENMAALEKANPEIAKSLDYSHPPLTDQLNLGIRTLELDVFYDPGGKLFGRQHVDGGGTSSFPVMHVQNLDDRSSCLNLLECLQQLRKWSETHPDHLPIFISFNAKDEVIDRPGFVHPKAFDQAAWNALDHELRDALGSRLITPAEVFKGLRLVWPKLAVARGHFLTVLDEGGDKRAQYADRWHHRAMFADLPEGEEGAAIMIVNDPIADFARIQSLVKDGFIVRTRADADTREARTGEVERRDAAFASGAQLVSTDYYLPANGFGTDYRVVMPGGGIGRCDPMRVPKPCVLEATESAK